LADDEESERLEQLSQYLQNAGFSLDLPFILMAGGLIVTRVILATTLTPFMGGKLIPSQARVGLGLLFAVILFPGVAAPLKDRFPLNEPILMVGLFLKEVFVGLLLGFVASLVFHAISAAGSLIDNQAGNAQTVALDPFTNAQSTTFGTLMSQLALVLFFSLGGYRLFIQALVKSFEAVPLISFPHVDLAAGPMAILLCRLSADILAIGIQLAAPVAISLLLVDVVLGLAARVSPQIDVFFISFSLKTTIAVIIIFLSLEMMATTLELKFRDYLIGVSQAIEVLRSR